MTNEAVWLMVSFAVMVVAVLATLYQKVEDLEERLKRLDGDDQADDDEAPSADAARGLFTKPRVPRHRDERER